jgi:hypothetical protein
MLRRSSFTCCISDELKLWQIKDSKRGENHFKLTYVPPGMVICGHAIG